METTVSKLTVFFDDPFWAGLMKESAAINTRSQKITFGAEPKDFEAWVYLLENWES